MDNTKAIQSALEEMLTWLRNGATVVGNDATIHKFRETCLERAYVIASQDLTPILLASVDRHAKVDSVYNQHLHNLIDVSAMLQKKTIMQPLKPPPPLPNR